MAHCSAFERLAVRKERPFDMVIIGLLFRILPRQDF